MHNTKGFTTFELIVVIIVVALLATVALPKFYRLTLRAEALSAQGMIGQMRGALSMQMAQGLYRGDDLAEWAADGEKPLYPMYDLLLKQPEKYLGILSSSNQLGCWYDDKQTHELVYVVRNNEIVSGISGEPIKLRWRIEALYDATPVETLQASTPLSHRATSLQRQKILSHNTTQQRGNLLGLLLQPATSHKWQFE